MRVLPWIREYCPSSALLVTRTARFQASDAVPRLPLAPSAASRNRSFPNVARILSGPEFFHIPQEWCGHDISGPGVCPLWMPEPDIITVTARA